MTRLVLFDIDGTLIRTGGAGVRAFSRTAAMVFGKAGAGLGAMIMGALIPAINIICVLVMSHWGEGQGGGLRLGTSGAVVL